MSRSTSTGERQFAEVVEPVAGAALSLAGGSGVELGTLGSALGVAVEALVEPGFVAQPASTNATETSDLCIRAE